MELDVIVSEYKRLVKEAENSAGEDQEKIGQQLADLREEYKQKTGKNIDDEI
ncbi:MAG: hypothetical protein GWN01_08960 [Nitrosopumilaceae archaeon]|nr:hypothetical protein [Nitrosopumilaceae archaeon]NIU01038.1 hypothetical protein [Nitrosopumilaceae archaeon]NIU87472.1 hypothetical protein [Nitrosopumilaceae archaeon]NIV65521.1 hypothetical protein [Nitrosopumilaceae archaeon]NIX61640.1 hypothetical protein [Nitrosopumilaceae archaeon]